MTYTINGKEWTDLEIRQQISLIELNEKFPKAKSIEFDDRQNCFWVEGIGFTGWPLLEPLTDDALCFSLGFKFGVCIDYESGDVFIRGGDGFDGCLSVIKFEDGCFESLKRAVCLAIIKSKEL